MKRWLIIGLSGMMGAGLVACVRNGKSAPSPRTRTTARTGSTSQPVRRATARSMPRRTAAAPQRPTPATVGKYKRATFAGGCFWCMQPPFDKHKGVIRTTVGYTGGAKANPTYKEVAYGRTQHAEAIEVIYDPKKVSYAELLKVFWTNIDPTARNRQFVDVGAQYRAAIFYHNETQRKLAEQTKKKIAQSGCFKQPIVTQIVPASPYYKAEDYHQNFYKKSTYRYKSYRSGSGRDRFIETYWKPCPVFK